MGIVKAPGTVTVGVDKTGKHYKYEAGKGRGRQPLNLSHAQSQALASRGLRPGNTVNLSPMEAAQLGAGGGRAAPGSARGQMQLSGAGGGSVGQTPLGPNQPNPDIGAQSNAIIRSHMKSYKAGELKTAEGAKARLDRILSDENLGWLQNAGPAPTAAQKNFAGSILATVFGRDMGRRSPGDPSKSTKGKTALSVQFNPGGNGQHGHISLVDKDGKARGSVAFKSLRDISVDDIKQLRDDFNGVKRETSRPTPGPAHQLYSKAERLIDDAGLDKNTAEQFKSSVKSVLNRMPAAAHDALGKSITDMEFYKDTDGVNRRVRELDPTIDERYGEGIVAAGGFSQKTGMVILDGGEEGKSAGARDSITGRYAHEFTHGLDKDHIHSGTPEWKAAHDAEAKGVSNYAGKYPPHESFAEFGRLLYSGNNSREQVQAAHPKMYAFFESKGLLPDSFNETNTGKPTKMKDIFDTPMNTDHTNADGLKANTAGKMDSSARAEKTRSLISQNKSVRERPQTSGESHYQVYNDKKHRFEGKRYKSHDEALASHQVKALDQFHKDVAQHEHPDNVPTPGTTPTPRSPIDFAQLARQSASEHAGRPIGGTPQSHGFIQPHKTGPGIAEAYGKLKDNNLEHPVVRKAYENLTKEMRQQYDKMPIEVEAHTGEGEPYKSSDDMRAQVAKTGKLRVLKTNSNTFGQGHIDSKHPLLQDSGVKDVNGVPLSHNDVFRAVHDYYAHHLSPAQFGPKGEETAWRNHMEMTKDPLARWAMTSETRGQNSYVNYGPDAEHNKKNPGNTKYAPQKADLLPLEHAMTGDAKQDAELREAAKAHGWNEGGVSAKQATTPGHTGFTTAQGSTYKLSESGTTKRNKTLHVGHPTTDVGEKEESHKTVYVSPEHARAIGDFGELQSGDTSRKHMIVANGKIHFGFQHTPGSPYHKRYGDLQKVGSADIASETPQMGLHPVEFWKGKHSDKLSKPGVEHYGNWHPGSAITELHGASAEAPKQSTPAPKQTEAPKQKTPEFLRYQEYSSHRVGGAKGRSHGLTEHNKKSLDKGNEHKKIADDALEAATEHLKSINHSVNSFTDGGKRLYGLHSYENGKRKLVTPGYRNKEEAIFEGLRHIYKGK